jgi:hypothetical protein
MAFSSFHQPYSHRTRFQLIRSTTTLVQKPKTKTNLPIANRTVSQFKLIRSKTEQQQQQQTISSPKPVIVRAKSFDKPATIIGKNIRNKYKWIRTSLKKTDTTNR